MRERLSMLVVSSGMCHVKSSNREVMRSQTRECWGRSLPRTESSGEGEVLKEERARTTRVSSLSIHFYIYIYISWRICTECQHFIAEVNCRVEVAEL